MSVRPLSEPVSLAGPGPSDVARSAALDKTLRESGLFESDAASLNREEVLGRLNELLQAWVKEVTARKLSPDLAADAVVKLYTFGSYRLGVHTPGSDLDTLCIGPRHVSRDRDFFGRLLVQSPDATATPPPAVPMTVCGANEESLYGML